MSLNGYFGQGRMGVFAQKPSPIQVNYLGFPATLGAPYMDYIIADHIVIPEAETRFYDEKMVFLPDCYQVNDDRRVIGPATGRAAHNLPEDSFVFCNFNHGYKLTPAMFDSWMRILTAVPDSVLWLWNSNPRLPANLLREAEQRGVAGSRLIFAPTADHPDHLARLKLADLALDELPYNAHTTASDALWTGLPLLTCRGTAFPGRVAASLLTAIGLPELITENLSDFEARAIALAQNKDELAALRARLEENRATAPLFDTARYTRNIEAAYVRDVGAIPTRRSPRRLRRLTICHGRSPSRDRYAGAKPRGRQYRPSQQLVMARKCGPSRCRRLDFRKRARFN